MPIKLAIEVTRPEGVPAEALLYVDENFEVEYDDEGGYSGSTVGVWALPENLPRVKELLALPHYGDIAIDDEGMTIDGDPVPAWLVSSLTAMKEEEQTKWGRTDAYWDGLVEWSGPYPSEIFALDQFHGGRDEFNALCRNDAVVTVDVY